jgi:hypothetical protein
MAVIGWSCRRFARISEDVECLRDHFPEPYRRRTLLLAIPESPHYVDRLSAQERAQYRLFFPTVVGRLEEKGFAALDVEGLTSRDYVDRCHLSEEGGEKLARAVAPKVRELARRLGYTEAGEAK